MDPPDLLISPTISLAHPSPALSNNTVSSTDHNGLNLDLSLPTALSHLINHLILPLSAQYPHQTLLNLRDQLHTLLTALFISTWDEAHPQIGSGFRSLICTKVLGLPRVLRAAAKTAGVDESVWRKAIGTLKARRLEDPEAKEEWEAWCDPGMVVWRFGGWEWEDVGFEPGKIIKEPMQTIWQASHVETTSVASAATQTVLTPARPSHAIPIRAPTVFHIPPTPLATAPVAEMIEPPRVPSPSLLPAASISFSHDRSTSIDLTSLRSVSPVSSEASSDSGSKRHSSHSMMTSASSNSTSARGHGSSSSIASSVSDSYSGNTQLLTPASRPGSADPFIVPALPEKRKTPTPTPGASRGRPPSPNTPSGAMPTPSTVTPSGTVGGPTPSVTPYDGGNVTVLGGGVKLGGSSRPSSVISMSRTPIDRSRSPSISMASRALNTALGPNSNSNGPLGSTPSSPRKVRTRRRIMPTYLGHVGQPGVGGPVMGVFNQFAGKGGLQPGGTTYGWPHGQPGAGVGMAPPSLGMAGGLGMRPMTLGMQRMI